MNSIEMKLTNKEFLAELSHVESPVQLEALFNREGIELKEGATFEQVFNSMQENKDSELTEAQLENISGGGFLLAAALIGGAVIFLKGVHDGIMGK